MTARRTARLLMAAGVVAFILATAWWYVFYEQMLGHSVKQASECFYYETMACGAAQSVDVLFDVPGYSPLALYSAIGLFVLGMALNVMTPDAEGNGGKPDGEA